MDLADLFITQIAAVWLVGILTFVLLDIALQLVILLRERAARLATAGIGCYNRPAALAFDRAVSRNKDRADFAEATTCVQQVRYDRYVMDASFMFASKSLPA